jgi:hypothetical protein
VPASTLYHYLHADGTLKAPGVRLLGIDPIAEAYWHIHRQHRSAWTHEIDLRLFKEQF